MDGTTDVGEERRARRWSAALLSLVTPGLGHLAIGHPRRMVAWFSSVVVLAAAMVVSARHGVMVFISVVFVVAVAIHLAAAVDTLRLPRPAELPRPRNVALMAVGLFAFWEIIGYQVRSHVIEAFQIPSASMYPTLVVGDHVFADKTSQTYAAGDVVVFKYPRDPDVNYVKRIIAVGGDTVESDPDGQLVVNGRRLPDAETSRPCAGAEGEPCAILEEQLGSHRYLIAHEKLGGPRTLERRVVPPGTVFVVGDNRERSSDSRVWGPVRNELLLGKVIGIWWSRGPEGIRWDRIKQRLE